MNQPTLRDEDLAVLRQIFRQFPWITQVMVFGSRATGHAQRRSDIDLAIVAPSATVNQWHQFTNAIEKAPIIHEFDLVRLDQLNNAPLLEKIEREGISIYPEILKSVGLISPVLLEANSPR